MPLAERDSQLTSTPPTSWETIRADGALPGWEWTLVIAAVAAILIAGVAFVARRLGLRRRLSWLFALGVGLWLSAPFTADSGIGNLLAVAGLLVMPAAVLAEVLLRRREHRVRSAG